MPIHRTSPENSAAAGWVPLDDVWEVVVLPLVDRRYVLDDGGSVLARNTYADLLEVAKRYDAEMLTGEDLAQLKKIGIHLKPYFGTPTAEITLHHSRLHDADVNRQLIAAGWDGTQAVSGAGKHWIAGAPPGRSRLMGWDGVQPDAVAHNRGHHDDGTTSLLKRKRRDKRQEDIPPPSDTDPAPPNSAIGDELDHGQRCIDWMLAQMKAGIHEQPDGSNNGPEIGPWLGACVRDGQPGIGKYLELRGANWCAAAACAADAETRRETDPPSPCGRRCSGLEIETDAKDVGAYHPVSDVLNGTWEPQLGDFVLMQRGDPGSWKRHVTRFIRWIDRAAGLLETIGGNEGNAFQRTKRYLKTVLCFVAMSRGDGWATPISPEPAPKPDPADLTEDGDNALERDAWPHMRPSPWVATDWHSPEGAQIQWAADDRGIRVRGEDGPRRTKGKPITLTKIRDKYAAHIEEAAQLTGVDQRLIAAMIATESGLDERAERREGHLNDWSFGVTQTLTATAYEMAKRVGLETPDRSVPRGGAVSDWRAFLFDPRNSILCGAAYLDYTDERFGMLGDPVLAYSAYNSGSPRVNLKNPWGVTYFRHKSSRGTYDAMNTFVAWYGDACVVF